MFSSSNAMIKVAAFVVGLVGFLSSSAQASDACQTIGKDSTDSLLM
jgi:hypothetical protein